MARKTRKVIRRKKSSDGQVSQRNFGGGSVPSME